MSEDKAAVKFEVDTAIAKVRTQGYRLAEIIQGAQAVIMAAMLVMLYDLRGDLRSAAAITVETAKVSNSVAASTRADHDMITAALTKATEAQQETTYLFTIPQAERERMNIRMPDSLRRRMGP